MTARRFVVTGLVQGVFFRAETKKKADALLLTGWVRNLPDGSVEIFAEGSPDALNELETWTHKGPERARVDRVEVSDVSEEGFTRFEIVS